MSQNTHPQNQSNSTLKTRQNFSPYKLLEGSTSADAPKFEGNSQNQVSWKNFEVLGMLEKSGEFELMVVRSLTTSIRYLAKILQKPDPEETNSRTEDQLHQEYLALSKLHHHGIIRLYLYFEDTYTHNLILELLEEGVLYQKMVRTETCSLPEALTANYVFQLLTTLDHIHDSNFIHRDIKPENIWLKNNSRKVVLTNFEQSCKVKNHIHDRRNTFCGTMEYLSPEMIEKSGHTYKTDVWMLGILTYEMLFGFSPFASENENILEFASETYANILYNDVFVSDNPTEDNMLTASKVTTENSISNLAKDFIRRVLSKDPADRDEISELVRHEWFKEQLGLAKWSQMKQGFDKQKEASNTSISMGTKFGQGSKTDLENILQNSKLDETGPFHNAHFIRPNQNIILDDLQENLERRFSEKSEADSMFSLNIEMVSCIGAQKPNQQERYPKAMSAFHNGNFGQHKRAASIHPDNMTILDSIQQTPRGKTSVRPIHGIKGISKLDLDGIRIEQHSEKVSPRNRRPEQIIRKLQNPNLIITECEETD
jgi:serine/threonine protein kinase